VKPELPLKEIIRYISGTELGLRTAGRLKGIFKDQKV